MQGGMQEVESCREKWVEFLKIEMLKLIYRPPTSVVTFTLVCVL